MAGWTLVLGGIVAAVLGVLSSVELDQAEVLLVERGVVLSKSRARVFSFVSNLANYAEWFPGTVSFEATDSTPMSIGKHFREVYFNALFGEVTYDNVMTGYESPRYIGFLNDGFMQYRVELEFEKLSGDTLYPTRMVYRLYSRRHSLLFKHILAPVLGYWMNELWIRPSLFSLRAIIDSNRV